MANTTLKTVIDRCRLTLQEVTSDGTRWKNEELIDWAGEFYQLASGVAPSEFADIQTLTCAAGTKQEAPSGVVQILEVIRNLDGDKRPIFPTEKTVLDSTRRTWHSEEETLEQEVYVLDERYPNYIYVWPPALAGSLIEIAGVVVPSGHVKADYTGGVVKIKCSDRLVPAMVDYILYRAYSKDAEFAGNAQRAASHFNTCLSLLSSGQATRIQFAPEPSGSQYE